MTIVDAMCRDLSQQQVRGCRHQGAAEVMDVCVKTFEPFIRAPPPGVAPRSDAEPLPDFLARAGPTRRVRRRRVGLPHPQHFFAGNRKHRRWDGEGTAACAIYGVRKRCPSCLRATGGTDPRVAPLTPSCLDTSSVALIADLNPPPSATGVQHRTPGGVLSTALTKCHAAATCSLPLSLHPPLPRPDDCTAIVDGPAGPPITAFLHPLGGGSGQPPPRPPSRPPAPWPGTAHWHSPPLLYTFCLAVSRPGSASLPHATRRAMSSPRDTSTLKDTALQGILALARGPRATVHGGDSGGILKVCSGDRRAHPELDKA